MNIAILDQYQISDDFEKRAQTLTFPAAVWNIAAEVAEASKPISPFELEKLTGQGAYQIREALERLLDKKLVRQNHISWEDFTETRKKARTAAETSVAQADSPANVSKQGVALRLGSLPHQTASGSANKWAARKPDPS